jgi:hypothetical protein
VHDLIPTLRKIGQIDDLADRASGRECTQIDGAAVAGFSDWPRWPLIRLDSPALRMNRNRMGYDRYTVRKPNLTRLIKKRRAEREMMSPHDGNRDIAFIVDSFFY